MSTPWGGGEYPPVGGGEYPPDDRLKDTPSVGGLHRELRAMRGLNKVRASLLGTLRRERGKLARERHAVAMTRGWG